MALISYNNNSFYGFNASFDIDRAFFAGKKAYTTETKTVDGMPDVKWCIKVYPTDPTYTSSYGVYVCVESEKEINYKINGKYESPSISHNDTTRLFYVNETSAGGNMEICIDRKNLHTFLQKNYFFDGKLKFQIDAAFSYKEKSKNVSKICCPAEWGLRLKGNSSEDFEIVVGGETFRVHKFIFAAESPVFKKMFDNNFKEARESKVTLTDADPEIVKAFIDYCYGRETFVEDGENKVNVLYFADKYDCQTLKPQLEAQLASEVSKESLSFYVTTADKANALQLRQSCIEFVRNLLKNDGTLTAEEMDSFDMKFVKDVFAFNSIN